LVAFDVTIHRHQPEVEQANDTLAVRRAFGLDDRLEPDPPLYFAGEGADTTPPT
jgi:hypothetical protein